MNYDSIIVGSGFGGLGTALQLAELGQRVLLLEALKYPGGCASTFERQGYRFESGATLFSGFEEGQLFHRWKNRHQMNFEFHLHQPTIIFSTSDCDVKIYTQRQRVVEQFCEMPNAPVKNIHQFFAIQKQIADILWPVFDHPNRLPPFDLKGLLWHIKRSKKYFPLLRWINHSLFDVLEYCQLDGFLPLIQYCNAISQITIQSNIWNCEAPFALATLDYIFRGTGHIEGGVGVLADEMCIAIQKLGGDILFSNRVRTIYRHNNKWMVSARNKHFSCSNLILNLLPQDVSNLFLIQDEIGRNNKKRFDIKVNQLTQKVESGWGAAMLYLILKDSDKLPADARHYQGVLNTEKKFQEGNHIFCSLSSRTESQKTISRTYKSPIGERVATISTHVDMTRMRTMSQEDQGVYINNIQEKMKRTLEERFPQIFESILRYFPASPRTFKRYTRRASGLVGGVPRNRGWHNYQGALSSEIIDSLWLVGDSVFPGQSTLATALGGARTARAIHCNNRLFQFTTSNLLTAQDFPNQKTEQIQN